jgi:RNA polymerase sigma-70 factor (ECF subfamily)
MDTAEAKFDSLFQAYEAQVRNYCARRVDRDVVDDVLNDTFAVAWRKIDLAPDGPEALPWLYAIAHHVISHVWRTNGRYARLQARSTATAERPAESLADGFVECEDRRRVLEAASRLDEADQEILRLTLWEELTPTHAAVALGITPEAARQRASRARSRLAAEFHRLCERPESWARPSTASQGGAPS